MRPATRYGRYVVFHDGRRGRLTFPSYLLIKLGLKDKVFYGDLTQGEAR